jgi:hypothetical protein
MQPSEALFAGAEILAPALVPYGFHFEARDVGRGSGGDFAWGEFVRNDRRLELHFRHSLGLVTYHVGAVWVGHRPYLRALGVPANADQYPGVSDDPMDGFHRLRDDLTRHCTEFVTGSAETLQRIAAAEMARLQGLHRATVAGYEGDDRKRSEARTQFYAGDYDRVVALLGSVHYPELLPESERVMLRLARRRAVV